MRNLKENNRMWQSGEGGVLLRRDDETCIEYAEWKLDGDKSMVVHKDPGTEVRKRATKHHFKVTYFENYKSFVTLMFSRVVLYRTTRKLFLRPNVNVTKDFVVFEKCDFEMMSCRFLPSSSFRILVHLHTLVAIKFLLNVASGAHIWCDDSVFLHWLFSEVFCVAPSMRADAHLWQSSIFRLQVNYND